MEDMELVEQNKWDKESVFKKSPMDEYYSSNDEELDEEFDFIRSTN